MVTKSDVEKVIVARPGVATPNPGDKLFNDSTKVFNLGVGGIGAYIDDAGSGNPVALDPGAYAGQPFRFIQVRDTTNDKSPLYNRVLEQSQYIHGNCPIGIQIGGEGYSAATSSSWVLGAPNAASSGKISIQSNNSYKIQATSHGYRTDMYNSVYNHPTNFGRFESLNWADTSISTENNRRDYTVKALVQDFNRNVSTGFNKNAVALAIDTAGTTTTGTVVNTITAGSTITIGYDFGCAPVNLYVTEGIKSALAALETYATTATSSGGLGLGGGAIKIAPYALPDHCSSGEIAGDGSATADMIFMVALDETQAYYDELPQTKRRIQGAMDQGSALSAVSSVEISDPNEGEGMSRNLRLLYENTEHYRSYTSSRKWGANHVSFPDEIVDTEKYDIYTISHCHSRVATSGMPAFSALSTIVGLVHFEDSDSAYYNAGNPNPQKTYIESVINAVATYNGLNIINL